MTSPLWFYLSAISKPARWKIVSCFQHLTRYSETGIWSLHPHGIFEVHHCIAVFCLPSVKSPKLFWISARLFRLVFVTLGLKCFSSPLVLCGCRLGHEFFRKILAFQPVGCWSYHRRRKNKYRCDNKIGWNITTVKPGRNYCMSLVWWVLQKCWRGRQILWARVPVSCF